MKRNARRISTESQIEDVDLSPEREQASVTVRTMLININRRRERVHSCWQVMSSFITPKQHNIQGAKLSLE